MCEQHRVGSGPWVAGCKRWARPEALQSAWQQLVGVATAKAWLVALGIQVSVEHVLMA